MAKPTRYEAAFSAASKRLESEESGSKKIDSQVTHLGKRSTQNLAEEIKTSDDIDWEAEDSELLSDEDVDIVVRGRELLEILEQLPQAQTPTRRRLWIRSAIKQVTDAYDELLDETARLQDELTATQAELELVKGEVQKTTG